MLDNIALRFQKYAPLVLRIGLAAVFILIILAGVFGKLSNKD